MKKLFLMLSILVMSIGTFADSNSCKISGRSGAYVYANVKQIGASSKVSVDVNAYGGVSEGAVTVEFDWKDKTKAGCNGHEKVTVYFSNGKGNEEVNVGCGGTGAPTIVISNVRVYNAICTE